MKKILVGVVGVLILLLVIGGILSAITPTDFAVEREIVVNKPKSEVFNYLKIVKNQDAWSPWIKKDPKIKQTYKGKDGEVGFVYSWTSDHRDVGAGEQEIKKIVEGERIDSELRFKIPFESTSPAYFTTETVEDNKTKVKWGFSGSLPRPFNVMNLMWDIETTAGAEFEEGLKSLKEELEKQTAKPKADDDNENKTESDADKQ